MNMRKIDILVSHKKTVKAYTTASNMYTILNDSKYTASNGH